jgi:flagellar motor protein MotB
LSEARAGIVFKYLKENGIDSTRMTKVGYGNHNMLYPNAKDEFESMMNRRVEIMVLSFDGRTK